MLGISPELGNRLKTPGAGVVVAVLVGGEEIARQQIQADGITVDEKNSAMDAANQKLDKYQQVQNAAKKSDSPDAPETASFAEQKIEQAKNTIVGVSGKDPVDSFQDHVDAFTGWVTVAGFVAGTAITHVVRRRNRNRNHS